MTTEALPTVRIQEVDNATALPFPVGRHGGAASLLSDKGPLLAIAADDGRFTTVNLTGAPQEETVGPCAAGHSAGLAYQPFVF
jgi:hypothetical protein